MSAPDPTPFPPQSPRPQSTPRGNSLVVAAVLLACGAVAACAIVAIAYMLGWVGQREDPAVAAVASSVAAKVSADAAAHALGPGETLVEPAPAAPPPPMFPRYGEPTPPPPAPPPSAANRPTGVPKSPYLPQAPRPAPPPVASAPIVAPVESPRPRDPSPRESLPREERYVEEVRPPAREESRSSRPRRFCANCAVVTAVSQYVDEWEVHLRFSDGSRRRIHYDRPPPVTRGDRVYFENGQLFLE
jgi:hypothetical protein